MARLFPPFLRLCKKGKEKWRSQGGRAGDTCFFRSYLLQRNLCRVFEVDPLPLEVRVRFVPDDEHNVGRDLVGRLVALSLERYLGAAFPARLHIDGEHLGANNVSENTCKL